VDPAGQSRVHAARGQRKGRRFARSFVFRRAEALTLHQPSRRIVSTLSLRRLRFRAGAGAVSFYLDLHIARGGAPFATALMARRKAFCAVNKRSWITSGCWPTHSRAIVLTLVRTVGAVGRLPLAVGGDVGGSCSYSCAYYDPEGAAA
jgi:hypothetical protein